MGVRDHHQQSPASLNMKVLVAALLLVALAQAAVYRDHSHGFECHAVGAFPDPDCSGFHVCQMGENDGFIESFYKCEPGTMYDSNTRNVLPMHLNAPHPLT